MPSQRECKGSTDKTFIIFSSLFIAKLWTSLRMISHLRLTNKISSTLQQQRPDISRLLQQMHAQQLPPGTAIGAHPGLPGLPGLGPAAGLPVPTSASAALLGLGLTPGAATAPGTTAAHPLSMLSKPELHRGQPDDLKSNGGEHFHTNSPPLTLPFPSLRRRSTSSFFFFLF